MLFSVARSQLDTNFYASTCPDLLRVIRREVIFAVMNEMRMAASLLRLHFHDCFVNVSPEFQNHKHICVLKLNLKFPYLDNKSYSVTVGL